MFTGGAVSGRLGRLCSNAASVEEGEREGGRNQRVQVKARFPLCRWNTRASGRHSEGVGGEPPLSGPGFGAESVSAPGRAALHIPKHLAF